MVSDYWGLNTLLTFHNYTDNIAEVVVPSLPDDIKLQPSDFLTMAVRVTRLWLVLVPCIPATLRRG